MWMHNIQIVFGVVLIVNFVGAFPMKREIDIENTRTKYSDDQLYFPDTEDSESEIFRIQRAIKSRGNKKQKIAVMTPAPMIIFDEDNIEPLAPEPVFKIRIERPPSSTPVFSVPRWPPMISDAESETLSDNSVATSKPTKSPLTEKQLPSESEIMTSTPNSAKNQDIRISSSTTSPEIMPDNVENVKQSDEIFIDGSLYVPFKAQNLENRKRRLDTTPTSSDFKFE
ncbi:uncharacterized protein LOC110858764 [Folsomia candida]|uniref:Uncharacterized protein n=1 Tax=Folsomia candida TaxID=158441 RepID=A0A226DEZ4_FOLCA|nr:uncharacterized protein LOC110858764 [Folsomia candida]OXA43424.1 hypothetical protein Fcan01_21877 [Folsomia candida]